jgi:hypothetical protein
VTPISKDTRFFQCACDFKFFFYDSLESLSLPFYFVELAPLYFYGMPQDADLFLRYVMSDDGNTLVEELGTLSYKPKGTSLTEIPSFRFFNWCGDPPAGPSFTLEFDGSFVAFDVRLWRKRIYELDDDKFEEGSYHPYLGGWERVIRKVKKVPDEYAYRRMVDASAQVDANLLQAVIQAQKKKNGGRRPGFGKLANLTRENLVGIYAYLWAYHQDNNLSPPDLNNIAAYLGVDRSTFFRWRQSEQLISEEDLSLLQQEAIELSKSIPKTDNFRSTIFKP